MKSFDPNVVIGKLTYIKNRVSRLKRFSNITPEEYQENLDYQDIIERSLEVLIQAAADINRYILKRKLNLSSSQVGQIANSESFIMLAQSDVLPELLATELAESGKFRNVLAHLYDEILPEKVIDALSRTLLYYPSYLEAIRLCLDTMNKDMENEPC